MTIFYNPWSEQSHHIGRQQMARTLRQYRRLGLRPRIVTRGQSWNYGGMWFSLQARQGLRGFELTSSQECSMCGAPKPADQSCICFDNHCQ